MKIYGVFEIGQDCWYKYQELRRLFQTLEAAERYLRGQGLIKGEDGLFYRQHGWREEWIIKELDVMEA